MTAWYNEIDPYAAQWLRNLIAAGHIVPGVVDERSIEDVRPIELARYTQCHFFAGIGAWSLALRRAGWPDDRPVWTGSCPCQPFSTAGKGGGFDDERHLWPAWQWLIGERKPPVVFGEQVASKDAESWIDLVHADLEALGYAFGCVPFPAAGVGAPHIRDRNYWMADSDRRQRDGFAVVRGTERNRKDTRRKESGGSPSARSEHDRLAQPNRNGRSAGSSTAQAARYGDTAGATCGDDRHDTTGPTNGFWRDADWLFCRDGKWRPVEPGTFPLVNGASSRVGRLRAYGNCIVPQEAEEFIWAYMI